jgi:tetratricopeptide (TPR) repeat protein
MSEHEELVRAEIKESLTSAELAARLGWREQSLGHFQRVLRALASQGLAKSGLAANIMSEMSIVFFQQGFLDEAEKAQRDALSIAQEIGDEVQKVAALRGNLAMTLAKLGKTGEADALFLESETALEGALADVPDGREDLVKAISFDMATNLQNYGNFLNIVMRNAPESVNRYRRALALRKAHMPPHDPLIQLCQGNLGSILVNAEMYAEAETNFREVLANFPLVRPLGSLPQAIVNRTREGPNSNLARRAEYMTGLQTSLYMQEKNIDETLGLTREILSIKDELGDNHQVEHLRHCLKVLENAKRRRDRHDKAKEKAHHQQPQGASALSEETRARLIAELIDEDVDKKSKKTPKKKGK